MILLASLDSVLNIAKSFFGIGALIFVHEGGHFLVGRWCGVKAEAFSLGFGPVLAKWKPGETEYRFSAVPLGGYVKFLGENPDERGERDPRSFHAATYPRKVAIMLAGVTMNVVAAFVLFAVTFSMGWDATAPVVGAVVPGMTAWEYGVREGDEIVTINGNEILDFSDLRQETMFASEVEVVLRRDGAQLPPLRLPTRDRGEGLRQIGVGGADDGRITVLPADSPSDPPPPPFTTGDRVIAVDGKPVTSVQGAIELHAAAKRDTTWTVERDHARVEVKMPWTTQTTPKIGVTLGPRRIAVRRDGPAFAAGLRTGDVPLRVGRKAAATAAAVLAAIEDAAIAGPLTVRRDAAEISVTIPSGAARAAFADSVAPLDEPGEIWTTLPSDDGPARRAGLPEFCRIVEADAQPVHRTADLQQAVRRAADESRAVSLHWIDDTGREGTIAVVPQPLPDASPDLRGLATTPRTHLVRRPNLLAAMGLGLDRTHRWVTRIFDTLGSIVSGRVSGSKLSGPVGIAVGTYSQAKASWGDFLLFLGMISMNLAVLNVLPVPLLDGGQLAVHTIERVRGKPIPERVLEIVMWTGLVLLLSLVVYLIRNDILTLLHS